MEEGSFTAPSPDMGGFDSINGGFFFWEMDVEWTVQLRWRKGARREQQRFARTGTEDQSSGAKGFSTKEMIWCF